MSEKQGCFGWFLRLFGQMAEESYPYRCRDDFLSESERSFYHVLRSTIESKYVICPKVSLKEFIFTNCSDRKQKTAHQNKINLKHVDFLLCEPATMKPILAIELDDSSHKRDDRVKRDYFMNRVFETIGLPLVRFENKKFYKMSEIEEKITGRQEATARTAGPSSVGNTTSVLANNIVASPEPDSSASPTSSPATSGSVGDACAASDVGSSGTSLICPKCGIPMVRRTVRNGERAGSTFFGCPNYPKCREVISEP